MFSLTYFSVISETYNYVYDTLRIRSRCKHLLTWGPSLPGGVCHWGY